MFLTIQLTSDKKNVDYTNLDAFVAPVWVMLSFFKKILHMK